MGRSTNSELVLSEWERVKKRVNKQLSTEKLHLTKRCNSGDVNGIFDVYQLLLTDRSFNDALNLEIKQGLTLASAVKKTVMGFVDTFKSMDDDYLSSRAEDLIHLGNKIIRVIFEVEGRIHPIPNHPVILFAREISVSDIALFNDGQIQAILCSEGSVLSHTAILANAIGIPALLGLESQFYPEENERVIVDADRSIVIRFPSNAVFQEYENLKKLQQHEFEKLKELKHLPATTRDGFRVHLLANSGLLNDLEPSLKSGAEGIGLYRTEIPFMSCSTFPSEQQQTAIYKELFSTFGDLPVFMRVLDIGGDKQLPYFPINDEQNPALGWRGIRFCLDNTSIFRSQIVAMLQASEGYEGLHILAPMVSSLEQIISFKALINESITLLEEMGHDIKRPMVGCMIEVPAAISQIPFWSKELDFISIGSNDLCQYLLSVDRNNPRVAGLFDSTHPAVLHEIKRIVELAKGAGLEICLCGEMASDPRAVILLVGLGVKKLSLGAAQLPKIKKLIRTLNSHECSALVSKVSNISTGDGIKAELDRYLATLEL